MQHAILAAEPAYNVLLIVADDLRPALGVYGDKTVRTPNIDSIARDGVRFSHAYIGSWCMPSRATMLTGHHQHGSPDDSPSASHSVLPASSVQRPVAEMLYRLPFCTVTPVGW